MKAGETKPNENHVSCTNRNTYTITQSAQLICAHTARHVSDPD
jgi:hypothetical protein